MISHLDHIVQTAEAQVSPETAASNLEQRADEIYHQARELAFWKWRGKWKLLLEAIALYIMADDIRKNPMS